MTTQGTSRRTVRPLRPVLVRDDPEYVILLRTTTVELLARQQGMRDLMWSVLCLVIVVGAAALILWS